MVVRLTFACDFSYQEADVGEQEHAVAHYPILPMITETISDAPDCPGCRAEIFHARDHSLFVPRDFDVSPYFEIVKPSIKNGFNPTLLRWHETDTR